MNNPYWKVPAAVAWIITHDEQFAEKVDNHGRTNGEEAAMQMIIDHHGLKTTLDAFAEVIKALATDALKMTSQH